ncbi:1-deoxy-D-xylulose-5-phosphate reductoisomerase [Pelagibaculum spongiae]|uniref:1-deoxy-D-xylulose 5-phosphate reductoisomerase n=1 Tax=Pelagibaculum spongiae TaxID=2080658 RepID=A0A2V1GS83_9GAMM|nr:1-deoxy-D-xylulose-5-phosphate reductoisomerase [Pelagibaculum spongiae]PVZ64908.1 1-deoxy-D-xylulose-5-phosphate reductoisomerase [Pelagibaculum spongiae]
MRQIAILGATGSIGCSTLDVLARYPDVYRVAALTGHSNLERLLEQCRKFRPDYVVVTGDHNLQNFTDQLRKCRLPCELLHGAEGLDYVAALPQVDTVVAAIVGAAGLSSSLEAVRAGKRVLLANKESLVMSGELFMAEARENGALLLPVDSEHNAIFQCLPGDGKCGVRPEGVRRLLLTASGGPFLNTPLDQLESVTPDQACAHPNWSMGRKISVDSATMMNKGLELIEACHLFSMPPQEIDIVIHPQSVIHSMVEYFDGSVLSQMGNPDMRTPIAHALSWPNRVESGVDWLDLVKTGSLEFHAPDLDRFPALRIAADAAAAGGAMPVALNAANEIAVEAFLQQKIGFLDIARVADKVLAKTEQWTPSSLDQVLSVDQQSRIYANEIAEQLCKH